MKRSASAPGKIILSGEYAVVFGQPGIAVPAPITMLASFTEEPEKPELEFKWLGLAGNDEWDAYLKKIVELAEKESQGTFRGTLTVTNMLPLGKGMGSSTALVVSVARCLLGKGKREEAKRIEDLVNPGNSGLDFSVIWEGKPVLFKRGEEPKPIAIPQSLKEAVLIDTGTPAEITPELVAWVKERSDDPRVKRAISEIGQCTNRLRKGEDFRTVFPDHHRAQVALGVVPKAVQSFIADIERLGGAAKVIGAGGRTKGGGMVLAIHKNPTLILPLAQKNSFGASLFSQVTLGAGL